MELIELVLGAIAKLIHVTIWGLSKEGRSFFRDIGALLAGRPVKNRPRDSDVC